MTKHNDATRNRPEGERIIDAPEVQIDIDKYVAQIKNEDAWQKNDRNSITVFKTDSLRIVIGGLHKGAEMLPHKAEGVMGIHVLEGTLDITTDQHNATIQADQIYVIHKGYNYRVVASEETIYLLTMTGVHDL